MTRQLLSFGSALVLLALLPVAAAGAVDLPVRKAGLWEMKVVHAGSPSPDMTMQHCTDETTDKDMSDGVSPMAQGDLLQAGHPEDGDRLCQRFRLRHRRRLDRLACGDHRRLQFRLHGEVDRRTASAAPPARAIPHDDRGEVARRLQAGPEARRHRDARRHEDEHQGHGKAEGPDPEAARSSCRSLPAHGSRRAASTLILRTEGHGSARTRPDQLRAVSKDGHDDGVRHAATPAPAPSRAGRPSGCRRA